MSCLTKRSKTFLSSLEGQESVPSANLPQPRPKQHDSATSKMSENVVDGMYVKYSQLSETMRDWISFQDYLVIAKNLCVIDRLPWEEAT